MMRLSLRARLVIGLIVLSALGLVVAGAVTYTSVRSFLFDRTDQSLEDSGPGVMRAVLGEGCAGERPTTQPWPGQRTLPGTSPGDFVQLRGPRGEVLCSLQITDPSSSATSPPALPANIEVPSADRGPGGARFFTVDAREGEGRYRVRASNALGTNSIVVVATSLRDVEATLHRLLLIELLVAAAVLAALAAVGLWVVRLGLRPLAEIGDTAAAIAGGDLSRRVERAEPRTEVGRLGLALNAMLGRIESAFEAQAASERKLRRFVADASHELRTPLAAVRAYAELFGRGADRRPDDLARSMEGIGRESERMSTLVDDLLLLARLDEGRPLAREQVELEDVVREAVETARTVEPGRPIELEAADVTVLGDRERLRQIVDNLLTNVREHTPAGTPVHVRLATSNGHAVVEVQDSGPGLSRKDEERIFERFYRADESRSRASGGVGLGLAIVAAVAEAHGGEVSARSEPERGATFAITLPLAKPDPNGVGT